MQILEPSDWPEPKGYANGVEAEGRTIFVAGQVGWDRTGKIVSDRFVDQAQQALANILAVLEEGRAKAAHLTRLTWYVTDVQEYVASRKELGQAYRQVIGNHYPAMTLVGVTGLMIDTAKVEIEATAVVPYD